MPERAHILAPVSDELLPHLLREPLIVEHLFELSDSREAGFELPPPGLLVVRVPEAWWHTPRNLRELGPGVLEIGVPMEPVPSPWLPSSQDASPPFMEDPEIRKRYLWLADVWPPPALLRWLGAAAKASGVPLAYYHRREHGDDLYYDLAFLFGQDAEPSVLICQTFLVDTDDSEECVWLAPEGRTPFAGSVFATVLEHIGSPSRIPYFPPKDSSRFDWQLCRVDPREYKG